jgi:serine/threonine protein kinase
MLKKKDVLCTTYEKYIVEKQIGQGGNGFVYKANNSDGEAFAVKVIDRTRTTKEKLKRFKNEMAFCEKTAHPNIVKVLDNGAFAKDGEDLIFFVMPFYGKTLRERMQSDWTPNERIETFLQLLNALKFAHNKNVYHRDVKPENILIGTDGQAVLADFGIAHFAAEDLVTAIETKLTDRLANFQYSAPEQRMRNTQVSGTADVYAAGLILNEMFTGKIISGSSYAKISDTSSEWGYLDGLVETMIAQDPKQRLFPIDKVIFQLEVLDREKKAKTELDKIATAVEPSTEGFTPLETPNAIGAEYTLGILTILLDKTMPKSWGDILANGQYSHSALMDYPTEKYTLKNGTSLVINVPPRDERRISQIVSNLKTWLPTVTSMYNSEMSYQHESQARKKEQEKQNAIAQAQAALRINQSLQDLFN